MRTKKLTEIAVLLALSLIIFMLESLIPPLFALAPYVKIGLSNSVMLFVLIVYGEKESMIFMLAKNLLSSLVSGNWYAFPFNISGSFFSLITMILLYRLVFPKVGIIAISVAGALMSNLARTLVGALVMQTWGLFLQTPLIAVISLAAGTVIGALVVLAVKYIPAIVN